MKVAIVGSRQYDILDEVKKFVRTLPKGTIVVSGGARGVDKIAELEAEKCGLETKVFPAYWDEYGKSAGYKRNVQIVNYADIIVAFWSVGSKGTKHTIDIAREKGKLLFVVDDYDASLVLGYPIWKK